MNRWVRIMLSIALACALQSAAIAARGHFTELRYTLERSWTGNTPELTIRADGTVTVEGTATPSRRLDAASRREIARLVASVDWIRLRPHYDANMDDGDTARLRIAVDGRPYDVSVYGPGAAGEPPALSDLLRSLDRLRKQSAAITPIDRSHANAQPSGATPSFSPPARVRCTTKFARLPSRHCQRAFPVSAFRSRFTMSCPFITAQCAGAEQKDMDAPPLRCEP